MDQEMKGKIDQGSSGKARVDCHMTVVGALTSAA
jgi:hypothetical protein